MRRGRSPLTDPFAAASGRHVAVSAPVGSGVRRLDTLAFLQWTLPELARVLPSLPANLFIAGAPDGMWRGGLSGRYWWLSWS